MSDSGTITIQKDLLNKISSQMIRLKKQNLNFKDKIKNMKIFMVESLRQSQSIEQKIEDFSDNFLSTTTKYTVKTVQKGSVDQAMLSNMQQDGERERRLEFALREKQQEIEELAMNQKRLSLEMQKMRGALQMKDQEIEGLRQLSGQIGDMDKFDELLSSKNSKVENLSNSLNEKIQEVNNLVNLLASKDKEISHLSKLVDERNEKLKGIGDVLDEKEDQVDYLKKSILAKNDKLDSLAEVLSQKEEEIQKFCKDLLEKESEIEILKLELTKKEDNESRVSTVFTDPDNEVNISKEEIQRLRYLEKDSEQLSLALKQAMAKNEQLRDILKEKENEIQNLKKENSEKIDKLTNNLKEKEKEYNKLADYLQEKDSNHTQEKEDQMKQLEGDVQLINLSLKQAQIKIDELTELVIEKKEACKELEKELKEKQKEIDGLKKGNLGEIEDLNQKLKEKENECRNLAGLIQEREEELGEISIENGQLRKNAEYLTKKAEGFKEELNKCKNDLQDSQSETKIIQGMIEKIESKAEKSEEENRKFLNLLKEKDDTIKELKQEMEEEKDNSRVYDSTTEKLKNLEKKNKDLKSRIESKNRKIDALDTEIEDVKTEYSNIIERLRDERDKITSRMKKDNQILRKEVTALLDQKEDLRNHLQNKLKDSEKFREEIVKLEEDYANKINERTSDFKDYLSMTKIKLVKKVKSLLGVVQNLKDEILLLKEKARKEHEIAIKETGENLAEMRQNILDTLSRNRGINLMREPSNVSLGQQFGNNSKSLTPYSTQRVRRGNRVEMDYQSVNTVNNDTKIENLHMMLIEQKEANRKFLEMNYRSEDLSVTTEQQHVEDPDALEAEVQELRRLKDRLTHENFGLQSDVEELEEEKERCLLEIEEHENHLIELKGNFLFPIKF